MSKAYDNFFYGLAVGPSSSNQPDSCEDSLQGPKAARTDTRAHACLSVLKPMEQDVKSSARRLESIEEKVERFSEASDRQLHDIGDMVQQMETRISEGNANLSSFLQHYMRDFKDILLIYVKKTLDEHVERQTVELKIMMEKTIKAQHEGPVQPQLPGTVHNLKACKIVKPLEPCGDEGFSEGDGDLEGACQAGGANELQKEADKKVAAKLENAIAPVKHKVKDLIFVDQMHAASGDILQHVVAGLPFQVAVLLAIASQSIFLGWEVNDLLVRQFQRLGGQRLDTSAPVHVKILRYTYSIFFSFELILRIAAWRRKFFDPSDKEFFAWNIFDVALCVGVFFELFEVDLEWFRVVRLLRVARVLRIASMFSKLRKMVYALMNSLSSLLWLIMLLTVTLYIFTLAFMQGAHKYLEDLDSIEFERRKQEDDKGMWIIINKFGSVFLTMRSLYAAITGGDPWDYLLEPIMAISWVYSVMAMGFVLFFLFAFMNVVTGVFVDEAMKISQIDREAMIADAMQLEERTLEDIKAFVANMDSNDDGTVTCDELISVLKQERVQQWLIASEIDLNPDNAQRIFKDLDPQRTGEIEVKKFIDVLSKLQGQARSADLFLLTYDIKLEQRDLRLVLENQHGMMERLARIISQK